MVESNFTIKGNIVDVVNKTILPGAITVENGIITHISLTPGEQYDRYIMPGFIDAHIHIESSMLVPSEFARLAVVHGTVATVSDPHEIANIKGIEGVRYMIQNAAKVPFHFYFGASPCVPATSFETAGAVLTVNDLRTLFEIDGLKYLSEMMNYPGVLARDPEVMEKIALAHQLGRPIDGHAPGLKNGQAEQYIKAGISTDHECYELDEALDKIRYGMKIIIREGSAAKNFEALYSLIDTHPDQVMLCSDDKHPNDLVKGEINELVKKAIVEKKLNLWNVLRAACYNPILHYHLDCGLLRKGDSADFIVVDNLHDFTILQTYIKGILVAEKGNSLLPHLPADSINHFNILAKIESDFAIKAQEKNQLYVINAEEGQLITGKMQTNGKVEGDHVISDPERDILKLVVVNRYQQATPAIGFIHQFGLKKGALASCIAHDSHNIIAVGVTDREICQAVNAIIAAKGGIAVAYDGCVDILPLPIGGIMSDGDGYEIANKYAHLDRLAKSLGTKLQSPFMTLSFMALLVIPSLKLSDKGLFDGDKFALISPLVT